MVQQLGDGHFANRARHRSNAFSDEAQSHISSTGLNNMWIFPEVYPKSKEFKLGCFQNIETLKEAMTKEVAVIPSEMIRRVA